MVKANAPPLAQSSKNNSLDDSTDATMDEFRKHQQDVLAGRFPLDNAPIEGTPTDEAQTDSKSKYTIVLDPEIRQSYLKQLESKASLCLEIFSRALRECAGDVEEAMLSKRDIIRSFVAAGLIPHADDEDCEEAVEIVLEALLETSRAKLGQALVDKRKRLKRVTVGDVVEYVRSRIASLVYRAADLTDTHLAAVDWAFVPKSEEKVLAQLERRLVEARFLEHCKDERSAPTMSTRTVPCCVYLRSKRQSLWLPFRRALPHNRDAVTIICSPLRPWTLLDGVHAEYDVTMFPCRLNTPFHGMQVAVLACDWSVEASRREGHPTFYLAKFITDYYLKLAALNAKTWHEAIYNLKHIHKPLLIDKYRALAYKIQDKKGMQTWTEDMTKLQLFTFPTASQQPPPPQQSPERSSTMEAHSAESPRHHAHQHDPLIVTNSQLQPAQYDHHPTSAVLYHEQRQQLYHQEQLHMERHSFSCEDHRRRVLGLKRLRSLSQGPPDLDNFDVDFELSVEPHRTSA